MPRRETNWARIGAEGLAIVLSILLAFSIDAWWAARQERAEAVEILRGLEEEFGLYHDVLEGLAEVARLTSEQIEPVIAAGPPTFESPPPPAQADLALMLMSLVPDFEATGGALDAVLSSGRLGLIADSELRARLASWQNLSLNIRDNEAYRRSYETSVVAPFIGLEGRSTFPGGSGLA